MSIVTASLELQRRVYHVCSWRHDEILISPSLTDPKSKCESRNERRPLLEVRSQEIYDPAQKRANTRGSFDTLRVPRIEEVFETRRHTTPIHAYEVERTEVLCKPVDYITGGEIHVAYLK